MTINDERTCDRCGVVGYARFTGKRWLCSPCWAAVLTIANPRRK